MLVTTTILVVFGMLKWVTVHLRKAITGMKLMGLLFCMMVVMDGEGQYYFNDILSNQLTHEQYKLMRTHKIRKIIATSYESDNTRTEGFMLEQDLSMDGKKMVTLTAISGRKSLSTSTYELNKLKRTVSDNNGIDNRTEYFYDTQSRLNKLVFTTTDSAMKASTVEIHEWQYDSSGKPFSMLKIKNKTDTTIVALLRDEQGNIAEERWMGKGRRLETYYYYYGPKNELTDIVRYNNKLKKLVADYLFEYDATGRMTGMTQVSMATGNYFTWKYTYTEKGMKQEETGFDKRKQPIARIVYSYQ